jgi:non-ribosomal peptide synthase protein (TIGR01720 family)
MLLREVSAGRRGQVQDALLASLAAALSPWAGEGILAVDLEGHWREDLFADVDLSRTVGWFTSMYPIHLRLSPDLDAAAALPSVRAALDRVPGHGFGFGLLRYLSPEGARTLSGLPAAEVRFNYLGQLGDTGAGEGGSLFRAAWEDIGPATSPRVRRRYLLDVTAAVRDGRLWVGWTYCERTLRRETVERLAEAFLAALRSLAAGVPRETPEDFPLARLSRQDLDRILGKAQRESA